MDYLYKTLDEIESMPFKSVMADSSSLVRKVHELRQKKLIDYSIEDLRIMIGQKQGLNYLMPLALNNLETEPFIEGDFYEGDLLVNVLTCECFFWKSHPEYLDRMDKLIKLVIDEIEEVDLLQDIKRLILDRISEYRNCVS